MLSVQRSTLALTALALATSLPACGSDSNSTTTTATTSGGASGSSSGATGGTGGAGMTAGSGGTSGAGNSGPHDAAVETNVDDATSAEAGSDNDGFVSCAGPTDPVDFYQPNLIKRGKNGALDFQLVESDIAPPGQGIGTWIVKVMQPDGGVMSGDLAGRVTMPNHTHPVTVQPEPTFDADKSAYVSTPMYFFLPGYWRATFTAYAGAADAGAPIDTVDFNFCVQ